MMKVVVLFLVLAFNLAQSQDTSKEKLVCVKKNEVMKLLKGRSGLPGLPGLKGERGVQGDYGRRGFRGYPGPMGIPGNSGAKGFKGDPGDRGLNGFPGLDAQPGYKGDKGDRGVQGTAGEMGEFGPPGVDGDQGEPGGVGPLGVELTQDIVMSLLTDYYVSENDYFDNLYHVTSRELTDGRTSTGGWGSASNKTGNYIQATYVRPVYVKSVTLAGGFIPSWGRDVRLQDMFDSLELAFSQNGRSWKKAQFLPKPQLPADPLRITHNLRQPILAQYWRLTSSQNKLVGTTEFALKPLIPPNSYPESSGDGE